MAVGGRAVDYKPMMGQEWGAARGDFSEGTIFELNPK